MSKQSDLVSVSQGSGGDPLYIDTTNDRVGVGNLSPQQKLHIGASDNTTHDAVVVLNNGGATGARAGIEWRYEGNTTPRARISVNASNQILEFDTAGSERMRIDSAGRVTMPYQPVSATYINGINGFGVTTNDNFFTKTGGTSHYLLEGITFNATNGRFTVPTAGKYLVSMYTIHRNGTASLTVKVNGSDWIRGYSEIAGGGAWDRVSMLGARNLSANDYLEVVHTGGNTVDYHGGVHSQFVIQMIG